MIHLEQIPGASLMQVYDKWFTNDAIKVNMDEDLRSPDGDVIASDKYMYIEGTRINNNVFMQNYS